MHKAFAPDSQVRTPMAAPTPRPGLRRDPSRRPRSLRLGPAVAAALIGLSVAGGALAGPVAFDRADLQAATTLQVTVPGLADGGPLPANYSAAGRNVSPPVSWTAGPEGTRSFVVLMQDADAAPSAAPTGGVNWLVYAIPASVLSLPRGMHNVASPTNPLGASQGRNDHDSLGYTGPRLALGEPPHHYHLQVFALDRPVRTRAGAEPPAVLKAMAGHVLARGELVATYVAPSPDAPHGKSKGVAAPTPAPAEPGR